MDRRYLFLALLIATFVLAVVLLWPDPLPMPPRGAHEAGPVEPPVSTVVIPVSYPYEVFAEGLTKRLPEVFVDKRGEPLERGYLLDLNAIRDGEVQASHDGDALLLEVPISVTARVVDGKVVARRAAKGKPPPKGVQVRANLVLEIRALLSLDEAWHMGADVAVSHRWRERPTLSIGILRLGIAKLADKQLNPKWEEVAQEVSTKLAEDDKLRAKIEEAWAEMTVAKQLSDDPETWLVTQPEALFASVPAMEEEGVALTIGLKGRFAVQVGGRPPEASTRALPPRMEPPAESGFQLALSTTLGWQSLSEQAAQRLVGAPLSDQVDVRVTSVELYPSGDNVAVALGLDADLPGYRTGGQVALVGRPVLSPEAQTVMVSDFGYGVQTQDVLLATVNEWAAGSVVQAVAPRLVFPYGDLLHQARGRVAEQLASDPKLSGGLTELDVVGVRVTEAGLVVDALAAGALSVRIDEAPPEAPIQLEPVELGR